MTFLSSSFALDIFSGFISATCPGEGLDWLQDGGSRTTALYIFYEVCSIGSQLERIQRRCRCSQDGETLEGHMFWRVLQVIGEGIGQVGECCR
ncbi:hypothetical protein ACJIZ3_012794 [Penstemon smallii]|uniref:Uncharacterized protein n=1 Tax=Penstemon smallii TaxID=265156 RepID=A0ABD3URM1_9LAMI